MISIFLQGFFLQASLIVALGAQNIFVLDSGIRKQNHLLVAFVSSVCDTLLILIGTLGIATFFVRYPFLKITLGIVGVGFLFFYGVKKLMESKGRHESFKTSAQVITLRKTILTSLGFSLLNPHVYLDTVVLVGGYSSKFGDVPERFCFGIGASSFSTIWFYSLAILASYAGRVLNDGKALRIVALISGTVLIFLSVKLGGDVLRWVQILS